MALGRLVLAAFWLFCTVLCVNGIPNAQTAISRLLFVRLTPSLHHSSSVWSVQVFLCVVNGFGTDHFGCILDLLYCFVCQLYHTCLKCHISASNCLFDPISSPFFICMILVSIFMLCKWLWDGSFWLHFGSSALCCVSMVPQIHKLSHLSFYLSVWPHLFTIPHLYDPLEYFWAF